MATTSSDNSQRMITQLKVLIPDLSLDPNTPERKIVDTVADVVAEASVDQFVLDYQYDIDTKVGVDLDKFVALFGFARQAGRQSTGSVTFSRATPAERDIVITTGTQVVCPATSISPQSTFFTTAPVVIPIGATQAEAPIQAADVGPLGNVAAGTITQMGTTSVTDVSAVSNDNSTTGGTSVESDAELRVRFKNTIFRNVSGTRDQYLALAIASKYASKANVIGPQSRFIEYIQIEPDLVILSQIPYSKWTYNFDYYVTSGTGGSEVFFTRGGVDYTFADTVPPAITVNAAGALHVGDVVLMEHSYCSLNSRNDPATNIYNNVDVYVSGQDATGATESLKFPGTGNNFVSGAGGFGILNWIRVDTGTTPTIGNRFQELLWQPIVELPSVITINGIDYFEGTHYWLVRDTTVYKGSRRSRDGIEWSTTVTSAVAVDQLFIIDYSFDKLPLTLNELMEAHKQVTTDVLVHSATERYFTINVVIMYTPGFSRSSVDEAISTALISLLEKQTFGAVIQVSDLLEVIHEVPGVDNVRLAVPSDGVAYGIQEVAGDGVTPIGVPHTTDFALQDSDLPVLNRIVTNQKSQNTW
jgi:uncharacterized phage protein gp47/JayE